MGLFLFWWLMPINVHVLAKILARWVQIRDRFELLDLAIKRYAKQRNCSYAVLHPDSISWLKTLGYKPLVMLVALGQKPEAASRISSMLTCSMLLPEAAKAA